MKSQIEVQGLRTLVTKEFLRELVEELLETSATYGGDFSETNAQAMHKAAEKLYNVIDALDIKP